MTLWEDVKRNIAAWYEAAADKTEELAKVGLRRYDIYGISRDIERQFSEIGSHVYNAVKEGRHDFTDDPVLASLVAKVDALEQELQEKQAEIERIKAEKARRARREAEAAAEADAATAAAAGASVAPDAATTDQTAGGGEADAPAGESPPAAAQPAGSAEAGAPAGETGDGEKSEGA